MKSLLQAIEQTVAQHRPQQYQCLACGAITDAAHRCNPEDRSVAITLAFLQAMDPTYSPTKRAKGYGVHSLS